jgi:hypothetical protein
MSQEITRFTLNTAISESDLDATLLLSKLAAAAMHGEERVRIHAPVEIRNGGKVIEIDSTREVGQTLALILGGYLRRELGDGTVRVERIASISTRHTQEVLT